MLNKIKERIYIFPYQEINDRPNLIYLKGDKFSLVVDAGHSKGHLDLFYNALKEEGLPLPDFTVITHWHWDHTLAMAFVNGLTITNENTYFHLKEIKDRIEKEGLDFFLDTAESIKAEYALGNEIKVKLPDIIYHDEMIMDLGNYKVKIFEAISPHTNDSTLVYVEEDEFLILGDSVYGTYPDWVSDKDLAMRLIDMVNSINPKLCIAGHGNPSKKKDIIKVILNDVKE